MSLRLLHRAVFEDSKNPVLQEICFFLDRYNAFFSVARPAGLKNPATLDEQASLLTGLFYRAAAYLTSKPPGGGRLKRKMRWDALTDLTRQLTAEAARVGVKLVRGPTDFRKTAGTEANNNMWLEVLDPGHRHGANLSALYEKWVAAPGKKSFWETIGAAEEEEVAYHRGEQDKVSFVGNRVVREDGELWSTRDGETVFSGKGWQIFVYSPDGSLYIHDHIASGFHHTSFLGGAAVLAAGELTIDQGLIRCLTAKTGHYWTTPVLMLNMVRRLPEIPGDALIRPNVLDVPKPKINPDLLVQESVDERGLMIFFRVDDFRRNGVRATPLSRKEVDDTLPSFAWQADTISTYINSLHT